MKMKKNLLIVNALFFVSLGLISFSNIYSGSSHSNLKSAGGPPYNTNAPGEKTCSGTEGTNSCHSGGIADNSGPATCSITSSGGTLYVPGQTYTITASITHPDKVRFGFQLSPRRVSNNTNAGTITVTDATNTWLHPVTYGSCQTCQFICHKLAGTSFPGKTASWTFNWTAPASNVGNVRLYACFNAANNNNNETGDEIYYTNITLTPSSTGINEPDFFSAINIYPNPGSGEFYVSTEITDLKEFKVFSAQGAMVNAFSSASAINRVDLRGQPGGVYFLSISCEGKKTIKKIVVL